MSRRIAVGRLPWTARERHTVFWTARSSVLRPVGRGVGWDLEGVRRCRHPPFAPRPCSPLTLSPCGVTTPRLIAWCEKYPHRSANSGRVYFVPLTKKDRSKAGFA